MLRYTTTLLTISVLACTPATIDLPRDHRLPTELELEFGEEKMLDGVLAVGFFDVPGDSRCPVDVTCIWEGNAAVVIGVRAGMGPTVPLTLNTAVEPRAADAYGLRVTLLEVTPQPYVGQPIPLPGYAVRIRVEDVTDAGI